MTEDCTISAPTAVPKKSPQIEASWLEVIGDEFDKPYMAELKQFLLTEKAQYTVYPPGNQIFNALNITPFTQVRVVILGQDPYHGPKQAHGLSFSVQRGVNLPPSLENIFHELHRDLAIPMPNHGDLSSWAYQGVLLLNTTLTVRARTPKSHAGKGWENFTDRIIDELNARREGIVFVLWGQHAASKTHRINSQKHLILRAAHPSPHSANKGFFGCAHFSTINQYLQQQGQPMIDWTLPPE
jgi:uracil-DNA glycosylase